MKTTTMVLAMVALVGQVRAQQETFIKQSDQVCAYVQRALPWFFYGYVEMTTDPLVVDRKLPDGRHIIREVMIRGPVVQQFDFDWPVLLDSQ